MAGFSVKKPLTVFVAVLAVIVLGVVAYLRMTPDLLPNMDFPYVIIVTSDPGASPEAVEQTITKPVEQSMATLDKIKEVTSTSQDSVSMVMLEFEDGANMDTISVDIQQKISVLQGGWADTVSAPYVLKINPSMIPAFLAYLIFLPGTMGVVPFDIPEAETEIIEGPLLEYGGPLLALFQITSALKTFVVLGLGVALFFPGTISGWWPINLLWFLFKCFALMLVSLTLVKSATGRFRIDQAFRFYVTVPTALALCSLILVWVM